MNANRFQFSSYVIYLTTRVSTALFILLLFSTPASASQLTNISDNSQSSAISSNGLVMAYSEYANGQTRLYYRQLDSSETPLDISDTGRGPQSLYAGYWNIKLSSDGRFVVYESDDSNLVADDNNNRQDVFIYDHQRQLTRLVSVSSTGAQAANHSGSPSVSGDGRYVVFMSFANNLTNDTNEGPDIFLRDTLDETTVKVSINSNGEETTGSNFNPVISEDGNHIAFETNSSNYGPDGNGLNDIYVQNRVTGITEIASAYGRSNGPDNGRSGGTNPSISADGRFIAYVVPGFWRARDPDLRSSLINISDTIAETTTQVSVGLQEVHPDSYSDSPKISGDGRFIIFTSMASNLVENDTNNFSDVFVTDLHSMTTTLLNTNSGTQANNDSKDPRINADGSRVLFHSDATNLVTSLTDQFYDYTPTRLIAIDRTITNTDSPSLPEPPEDHCVYWHASSHNGWGFDFETNQSCPPLTQDHETSVDNTGTCDYTDAPLNGGWGWNAVDNQSCQPLDDTGCNYSDALINDGWGWNPVSGQSCVPR